MKKIQAFTLIEITVSLTVFFIIMTIILNAGKNIFFRQQESSAILSTKQTALNLQTIIEKELKNIPITKNLPIIGHVDELNLYSFSSTTNIPFNIKYYNTNEGIRKKTTPYLSTQATDVLISPQMKISFIYLTNENISQEHITESETLKALQINIAAHNENNTQTFSHIINMHRNLE